MSESLPGVLYYLQYERIRVPILEFFVPDRWESGPGRLVARLLDRLLIEGATMIC